MVFSGDLDRAWAAFGLAITAASMGMEATIVFTFWGLMGLDENSFRSEVDGVGGTASWLGEASKSKLAFFI